MTTESAKLLTFATPEDAIAWMVEGLEADQEHCIDNVRFAFKDDSEAVIKYDEAHESGCCAYYDTTIIVAGREAMLGCNYGH